MHAMTLCIKSAPNHTVNCCMCKRAIPVCTHVIDRTCMHQSLMHGGPLSAGSSPSHLFYLLVAVKRSCTGFACRGGHFCNLISHTSAVPILPTPGFTPRSYRAETANPIAMIARPITPSFSVASPRLRLATIPNTTWPLRHHHRCPRTYCSPDKQAVRSDGLRLQALMQSSAFSWHSPFMAPCNHPHPWPPIPHAIIHLHGPNAFIRIFSILHAVIC